MAGSCSSATNAQVFEFKIKFDSLALDVEALSKGDDIAASALNWARTHVGDKPILIYSTAQPDAVAHLHAALGRERAGMLIEQCMARIAQGLVSMGVRRLVVAGGEDMWVHVLDAATGAEVDGAPPMATAGWGRLRPLSA